MEADGEKVSSKKETDAPKTGPVIRLSEPSTEKEESKPQPESKSAKKAKEPRKKKKKEAKKDQEKPVAPVSVPKEEVKKVVEPPPIDPKVWKKTR